VQLIVSGLDDASPKFLHLSGRYVLGFKPQKHCIKCFKSEIASEVTPLMKDGSCELKDDVSDLFYLCGVGQPDSKRAGANFNRKFTNVHLAVRPRTGSVASVGSVYGVTFTIKDAQAIPIQPLPDGFESLDAAHTRCKNFQFGYQEYEVGSVHDFGLDDIVYTRRNAAAAADPAHSVES
jgi:hypothetical protein